MSSERRQFRRIPLGATVAFQELSFRGGNPASTTEYRDVSAGGLLICSPREHALGTLLKLEIRVPGLQREAIRFGFKEDLSGKPLVAIGQVVRVEGLEEGGFELGIKFMNVSPEDTSALIKFIEASTLVVDN